MVEVYFEKNTVEHKLCKWGLGIMTLKAALKSPSQPELYNKSLSQNRLVVNVYLFAKCFDIFRITLRVNKEMDSLCCMLNLTSSVGGIN